MVKIKIGEPIMSSLWEKNKQRA